MSWFLITSKNGCVSELFFVKTNGYICRLAKGVMYIVSFVLRLK